MENIADRSMVVPWAGPNLERARVPEALCFTVGHALFADGVPGWHSLITAG